MSKKMQEMAEIRLTVSKNLISTFRDLADLKKLKDWVDEEWKDHEKLSDYIEKLRIYALECGKPELFEEWKRNNKMSYLGFKSLNELKAKLHIKICVSCGIAFPSVQKNRMYCGNRCKQRAFQQKKRNRAKYLTKKNS